MQEENEDVKAAGKNNNKKEWMPDKKGKRKRWKGRVLARGKEKNFKGSGGKWYS